MATSEQTTSKVWCSDCETWFETNSVEQLQWDKDKAGLMFVCPDCGSIEDSIVIHKD